MSSLIFPRPYIQRIILNSSGENINTEILVNLQSPENINYDIDTNNLQLTMLFVSNFAVSQMMDSSVEMARFIIDNFNEESRPSVPLIYQRIAVRKNLIPYHTTQEFYNMIRTYCKKVEITNFESISRDKTNNYVTHIERDLDISSGHLSVYLFVDFDKTNTPSLNEVNDSYLVGETILNNGKVASFSYGYYTPENDQIWEGEVVQEYDGDMGDVFYTNETPRRELVRRKFYNTKIQDFRVFRKAEARTNTLQVSEINKSADLQILNQKYYLKNSDNPIQFKNRRVAGIQVEVNLLGLLRKNSAAYNIIQNITRSELRNFSLLDIKCYRKRVREELPENVFRNTARQYTDERRVQQREDFHENTKRYYLSQSDIGLTRSGDSITITINDTDYANNITTGDYCYGIEVYFKDPIVDLLKNSLDVLERTRARLEEYYRDSTIVGYTDSAGNFIEGHYDPEINTFTQTFIIKWSSDREFYDDLMNRYIFLLNKITRKSAEEIEEEVGDIMSLISSGLGTPDNILTFLNMYETKLSLLRKIYELTRNNTLQKEEKYFNSFQQVLGKRQRVQNLQQFPFSMKLIQVGQLATNGFSDISIYETEKHDGYEIIRNILETDSNLVINADFSKIRKRREARETNTVDNLKSTSLLVDQLDKAKRVLGKEAVANIISGILGTPNKTTTKDIKNRTISEVYREQLNKKRRRGK